MKPGPHWSLVDGTPFTVRFWDGDTWTSSVIQADGLPEPTLKWDTPDPQASWPTGPIRDLAYYTNVYSSSAPQALLIRSPDDAEDAAAAWMRYWGYTDAQRTPTGPDGGLDVVADGAVAQVKDYGTTIGRPVVQQIVGAALGREAFVFARQGFTADAMDWADVADVGLFRFDLQGEPEPVNDVARATVSFRALMGYAYSPDVLARVVAPSPVPKLPAWPPPPPRGSQPPPPSVQPPIVWAHHTFPVDAALLALAAAAQPENQRSGRRRKKESGGDSPPQPTGPTLPSGDLTGAFYLWLVYHRIECSYVAHDAAGAIHQQHYMLHVADLTGSERVDLHEVTPAETRDEVIPTLPSRLGTADVASHVLNGTGTAMGIDISSIPHAYRDLRAKASAQFRYPIYIGIIGGSSGRSFRMLDGITGALMMPESIVLTAALGTLDDLFESGAKELAINPGRA